MNRWRAITPVALLCAGLLFAASASTARGTDLRPRNTSLAEMVAQQSQHNSQLSRQAAQLTADVTRLHQRVVTDPVLLADVAAREAEVGIGPVTGPGVAVTLKDAPKAAFEANPDVDPDLLVVHQQDIQAVVNALWAGGAEAIAIQDHRVISTTGIKCVGNSVILQGVPYLPPYRIVAIGEIGRLRAALEMSRYLQTLASYVNRYGLGYQVSSRTAIGIAGYTGPLGLQYARPLPG